MRTMSGGPCLHYDCSNRNSFGYCKTTACINEHYQQEQWITTERSFAVCPVLCKDCEYYIKHDKRCVVWNHGVHKDDYCSRGLKKEVEE